MIYPDRVKALRKSKGLSQAALGKMIESDSQHVLKIEHGLRRHLYVETLAKLADALDCSTDYLLGRTDKIKVA
jgi:transcriptional regulator with XRE-family HTH domain